MLKKIKSFDFFCLAKTCRDVEFACLSSTLYSADFALSIKMLALANFLLLNIHVIFSPTIKFMLRVGKIFCIRTLGNKIVSFSVLLLKNLSE